jgi:hypothetical protein
MNSPAKGSEGAQEPEKCPARTDILAPEPAFPHTARDYQEKEGTDPQRPIEERNIARAGEAIGKEWHLLNLIGHKRDDRVNENRQEPRKQGDRVKKERENHTEQRSNRDTEQQKKFKLMEWVRRGRKLCPKARKEEMIRKIDAGAQRTAEPAEKPPEYDGKRRDTERQSGKTPYNLSRGDEGQKTGERIYPEKPPAIDGICPGKTQEEKK